MMIARDGETPDRRKVWEELAAELDPADIEWRQDGKPTTRDGRHFARFVAYVEAGTVRERLDTVAPGEWDLTLETMPLLELVGEGGKLLEHDLNTLFALKCRLQVMGVIREDIGHGKDWKQASTDAFKRAAVRFGIGHELYEMPNLWVEMDGDGKFAKPVEDPQHAFARKFGKDAKGPQRPSDDQPPGARERVAEATGASSSSSSTEGAKNTLTDVDAVSCPKCGGRMWDNRLTKRNPKAPDYKCRDRSCDGVVWPPKEKKETQLDALEGQGGVNQPQRGRATRNTAPTSQRPGDEPPHPAGEFEDFPQALLDEDDDLPF